MTLIAISKEVEFDAGHRVPNHVSKCRNPHGHRYRVRVICQGPIITDPSSPEFGMLTDFGALKGYMTELIHDELDHAFMVHEDDHDMRAALGGYDWKVVVMDRVPTAENLARWSWDRLAPVLTDRYGDLLALAEVAVWETPTSVAYYRGEA